jgi:hypothetical protein
MHLALEGDVNSRRRTELLLSDLPGEWTTELVNRAETAARFRFLRRADAVIYVMDGPLLAARHSQQQEAHKALVLLDRLRETVRTDRETPLILLISKCDEIEMAAPPALREIEAAAISLEFEAVSILSACFSRVPAQIQSGTGVKDAIDYVLKPRPTLRRDANYSVEQQSTSRAFARFRRI